MIDLISPYRPARKDDAFALAQLVNIAGEGLPLYLWSNLAAEGESPWDVGRDRARRETGGFSYRNSIVREEAGDVVACMVGYPLEADPGPVDFDDMPAMFVPLQQLESMAPGTWYVNVLATYPSHRGRGYGQAFLSFAEQIARDSSKRGLSIIVSDANTGARRLYERLGYRECAQRPMVKENWQNPGSYWVLLVKGV